jgi:hypothetical protein
LDQTFLLIPPLTDLPPHEATAGAMLNARPDL